MTGDLMIYRVMVIDFMQGMNRCVVDFAVDSDLDEHLRCAQKHGRRRCNEPVQLNTGASAIKR